VEDSSVDKMDGEVDYLINAGENNDDENIVT